LAVVAVGSGGDEGAYLFDAAVDRGGVISIVLRGRRRRAMANTAGRGRGLSASTGSVTWKGWCVADARPRGGALRHLDPIYGFGQNLNRVNLGRCGPSVGPCHTVEPCWIALSISPDLVGS
jgi:hypothetical protein